MTWQDALRSALSALRSNLLRSVLTLLGIVIGVAAVILVVAIGDGARDVVVRQIRSLGSNLLIIQAGHGAGAGSHSGSAIRRTPTEGDAEAIAQDIAGVQMAVPVLHGTVDVVHGDADTTTQVFGVSQDFLKARDWGVTSGRNFSANESAAGSRLVLLGTTVARELFGDEAAVGAIVRIQGEPFTVIGVLEPKGQTTSGKDQDDVMVAPLKTVRARIVGVNPSNPQAVDSIFVKVAEGYDMDAVQNETLALLGERHRLEDVSATDFEIKNLADVLKIKESSARALAMLVAAVAGVSLVVGGIGIMNIMLVNVVERTREIGIRMAVGARRRDILAQFLVEAVTLSGIGGLFGLVLGIAAAGIIATVAAWPWIISPSAVVLAVVFSVGVGVVFGFYPARRASLLNPIEALRHE